MPAFRFSLQVLLEHRRRAENDAQRALAEFQLQRLGLEDQIRLLAEEARAEREGQRLQLAAGDLAAARMQAASIARIGSRADRAVLELAGLHKRIQSARALLLEAVKARKAVELLRERRHEEWLTEQNRLEAAATDEIAVMRASRSTMK